MSAVLRSRTYGSSWLRRRLVASAGLAGFFVLASAGIASAHVHVEVTSTAAEDNSQLSFRVPTESETASTTKVVVELPKNSPFTDVSVESLPGWTAEVTTAKLAAPVSVDGTKLTEAPSTVTWTANSAKDQIAPEQYRYFTVSVGPLPREGTTLLFPATQTYSDGKVVKWDQETPAGGAEPEYPSPELITTATAVDRHDDDEAGEVASAATTKEAAGPSDATARWLGGVGLGLGVIAVGVAALRGRVSSGPRG